MGVRGRNQEMQTDDPERAHHVFEQLYRMQKIEVHPEVRRFSWTWRVSPRGPATIIRGHAHVGSLSMGGTAAPYVLVLSRAGGMSMSSTGQRFDVIPQRTAGIANAGADVHVRVGAGVQTLNVRIDAGALVSHATALVGASVSDLRFDPIMDLCSAAGRDVLRLASLLDDACEQPDSPLGSPHVIAHLREALLSALLVGQGSSIAKRFEKPAPTVHSRAVKEAEEILTARASEPLSIAELASLTGVGLRSLERSFKATHGCSLREFLRMQRLELAHRRLRAAAPGTSVTQVLYASGFGHPGEFSVAYRKRFSEAPSDTLRRACEGRGGRVARPPRCRAQSAE